MEKYALALVNDKETLLIGWNHDTDYFDVVKADQFYLDDDDFVNSSISLYIADNAESLVYDLEDAKGEFSGEGIVSIVKIKQMENYWTLAEESENELDLD